MRVPVVIARGTPEAGARKRVYVEQYGCATTHGEAQAMRGVLAARGHVMVDALADADTAILVTCTVVDRTERRMVRRIRDFRDSGKSVVVSGCMASAQVDVIKREAPDALVLPPQFIHQVGELVERGVVDFCYAPKALLPKERAGAVASVVINEGCSGKCTFCLTKIARPGLRSYPVADVVEDVRRAVAAGVVEVRLTSQDSGAFGLDSGASLPDLVRAVTRDVDGDFGLRVGMLNPWTLASRIDDYVHAFRDPRVFRFLHVPIQSGSPRVLRAMARNHDVADVEDAVAAFRRAYPDAAVATDVICGFPGESDQDFALTLDLMRRLRPDAVNVTRYSPRPGTPAAALPPVPGPVALARSRAATALRFESSRAVLAAWVGRTVDALVTEPGTRPGTVRARTREYRQIVLPAEGAPVGARVCARVTASTDVDLRGVVVEK